MHPTPEQKEFLRTHAITRCPPVPPVGMFWNRSILKNTMPEEEIFGYLGSLPESEEVKSGIAKMLQRMERKKKSSVISGQSSARTRAGD
jgi:hypothetical protein